MASSSHVGKVVLRRPLPVWTTGKEVCAAVWVITGGLGALGQLMAEHLVRNGMQNMALLGRQGVLPRDIENSLARTWPASLVLGKCDVASRQDWLDQLNCLEKNNMQVQGVLHAGGSLEDSAIHNQTLSGASGCRSGRRGRCPQQE